MRYACSDHLMNELVAQPINRAGNIFIQVTAKRSMPVWRAIMPHESLYNFSEYSSKITFTLLTQLFGVVDLQVLFTMTKDNHNAS